VGIDATASGDRSSASTTIATRAFSTAFGNELLLAFVTSDYTSGANSRVTAINGAGLTWVLVTRTNAQSGTAEIWRAFAASALSNVTVTATLSQRVAASITVMSFTGVDTSGTNGSGAIGAVGSANANPGAPTTSLVTTRNNSLVAGVGNDWDNAISRTLGPAQTMVHQYLATVGDTYWVQRQTAVTAMSGTTVTINDTAPTSDRYNLSICEVLPAAATGTWTISGTVSPAAAGVGTVLALTGPSSATATADSNGNYSFTGLANGTYTVTPAKAGYTFSPPNQTVTVNGTNVANVNFAATFVGWSISGNISPGSIGAGTLVTLSGASNATTTADSNGNFSLARLASGTYTVTPSKSGYTFTPTSQTVTVNGANVTGVNFTANQIVTFTISGNITPANLGAGSVVTLSGASNQTTTADSSGNYSFTGLPSGSFTVTPSQSGDTFTPPSQTVTITNANVTGVNFIVQSNDQGTHVYPDLSDIIPAGKMSIAGTGNNRVFQYTHDTFNGGPGPLVIQPTYNPASGTYQGTQYIYSFSQQTGWTLTQQLPVAGAFIFDPQHGHFHFPFTTYGLYTVASNGGPGTPVATSGKVSFCINDSFIYDPNLPNAGALGNLGSCSDPTSLRGLDIGAVDEYDQTDEGQSISLAAVPDGTYWLRAVVDPNNFLFESDKTNNETDVELIITGNALQVLQTVVPTLPQPPAITMNTPVNGSTVSGVVPLTVTTGTTTGVQYLLDGQALGNLVTTSPYSMSWDTTTTTNGSHWLAAQTTNSTGQIGTSSVVSIVVANNYTPPVVTLTDPTAGSTVSASIVLSATVASSQPITSVSFYVDGIQIGASLTEPPYLMFWGTQSVSGGQHVITVSATDITNTTSASQPETVTVDNSHPPLPISKDVTLSVDASGVMQTPTFSTTQSNELLVAFVSYDGPAGASQTATLSGAGLTWKLVERSNLQSGTSEIWAALAPDPLTNVFVISQPGSGTNYHGSLTVIAFVNASGPGIVGRTSAPSGAPDIPLPGVSAGNWVFAVGNDWDRAVARTPVSGEVLVHQRVDTQVGDTYWLQSTVAPSTAYALVDIHDSSPTNDQWNYAAVEIVATPQ